MRHDEAENLIKNKTIINFCFNQNSVCEIKTHSHNFGEVSKAIEIKSTFKNFYGTILNELILLIIEKKYKYRIGKSDTNGHTHNDKIFIIIY